MKRENIAISNWDGIKDMTVPGYIVNDVFAITRGVSGETGETLDHWNLTHIPTGFIAAHYFKTREAPKRIAERFMEEPVDWHKITFRNRKARLPEGGKKTQRLDEIIREERRAERERKKR